MMKRMMEPDRWFVRVPRVHRSDGAFVSGELPAIVIETAPLDFHAFYVGSRDRIGRALALTLHDADLAADAVDEAMVRAYQRWSRVATLDNPAGWVYRVGLNYGRSRLRRSLRRPPAGPEQLEFAVDDPAIARALEELSLDHRAVVVCRLLLGWSESDTAAALRIRPGTAKSRLHRAVAHLESKLHHLRPEDP
jgi:RNA polymerase sigma-70 factor (ECF subfamily)